MKKSVVMNFKKQTSLLIALLVLVWSGVNASEGGKKANPSPNSATESAVYMQTQQTVTGRVTDADGVSMPGVTIMIEGTTTGSITDADGRYSITAPSNGVLVFSFIGYLTERIPINGRSVIDLVLVQDVLQIQEVVVTALGIKREKKALGYAVSEVSGEEVAKAGVVSPVLALQGKAAGVEVAPSEGTSFGGTKITIRGNSTLGSNNMPIFVVDGVIIDNEISGGSEWGSGDWGNNLKNLNSDEFETVTILKGSAATALYGSRALNGAVVITTKSGKARKDLGVKFSQRFSVKKAYDGPAFQNVYGTATVPGYASWAPDRFAPSKYFQTNSAGEPIIGTGLHWGHKMDGTMVRGLDGEWMKYVAKPNNFLDIFDKGTQSNTNVTLDGGGDNSTFIISLSNLTEKGIYPGNKFQRNSVFSKVTRDFNKYISSELSLSYANSVPENPERDIMQNFITGIIFPRFYDTKYWRNNYRADHGGIPRQDNNDPSYQIPGHGMWMTINENSYKQTEESLRITGKLNFNITNWFSTVVEGYVNNYYTKYETQELGQGYRNEGGYYSLGHSRKQQYDVKLWLNFKHDFGNGLDGSMSLVAEHWETANSYSRAWTNGGLIVPGVYALSNSKNEPGQEAYINDEKILQSLMFFTDLGWKNQLYLSITGRNDWSSTLMYADGTGDYSYFYPSVSMSWLPTETFELPNWINYGKLRMSWAHVGNDFTPYRINPGFSRQGTVLSYNGDLPRYSFKSTEMPNVNIRPENKKSIEFGLDARFLDNRLGIDFTYYKENTYNQILNIPAPAESGVNSLLINAGNIQNKGIEIMVHAVPLKFKDFEWNLTLNYARNRNKILELYEGVDEYLLEGDWAYGNTRIGSMAIVGGSYGLLVSDSSPRLFKDPNDPNNPRNGLPLLSWDATNRGVRESRNQEKTVVGDMNPDFTGSVGTGFKYKNFSLDALFDFKIGGDISVYSARYGVSYGLFESTLKGRDKQHGGIEWNSSWTGNTYDDGVIPNGVFAPGTTVQMKNSAGETVTHNVGGMTYKEAFEAGLVEPTHAGYWYYWNNSWGAGVINDNVLQENSYIGFRQLSLTYDIPRTWCQKIGLSNASVSLYGRDLGFLYKTLKDNLHPFSVRSNRSGAAHEWQQIPYVRTIGGAINITL